MIRYKQNNLVGIIMIFLVITILSSPIASQNIESVELDPVVKLSIASWPFPGYLAQGVQRIDMVYTNGTTYDITGWFSPWTEFRNFEHGGAWFYNTSLVIGIGVFLNNTLVGADDILDGTNYLKLNLTVVITTTNTVVFSQQNLTLNAYTDGGDPSYYYSYNATLNCFNTPGAIYECYVTYEVFF